MSTSKFQNEPLELDKLAMLLQRSTSDMPAEFQQHASTSRAARGQPILEPVEEEEEIAEGVTNVPKVVNDGKCSRRPRIADEPRILRQYFQVHGSFLIFPNHTFNI